MVSTMIVTSSRTMPARKSPAISTRMSAVGLAISGSAKWRSSVGRREKDMKREKICAAMSSIRIMAETLTESISAPATSAAPTLPMAIMPTKAAKAPSAPASPTVTTPP
jgi:hypothetical protein